MAKALLECDQHVRVAARLDKYDSIGMQPGKVQRRREQVAPAQDPEHGAFAARQDTGEKDGRRGIVGELGAPRDLMQRALRHPPARQMQIDRVYLERQARVTHAHALDLRDLRAQLGENGGVMHGVR